MNRQHVVVIGNGMVGQRFVEALRDRDTAGTWRVTVFGEEPRPAYDRVGLSALFAGKTPDDLNLVPAGCYDGDGAVLHLSQQVVAIDRDARTVTTAEGRVTPYDALVLATGSYPFVPPVPGADSPGCFVYRTIEDLDTIRSAAAGARVGAVVGGGLLGLEAANALRSLGLETHVVEFAPRLMPLQVDEGGGEALRRHVEALGVRLHLGARTECIETDAAGTASRMVFAEGEPLDVDLVVFSAGVRPRDELARASGLEIGARGGVVVDAACRTADPHVLAVGEVACIQGRVHGLVAPGYAMAEVAADQLLGGAAEFPGADTATKLKLLGVDVASFGDAFAATPGALELVYADPVAGVYKKLVVTDDATRLLGGVLVGDASAYAVLRPMAGSDVPLPPEPADLILPVRQGSTTPVALPGAAQVCSCHAVTKDRLCAAVHDDGVTDLAGMKACTKAGTGCGSCVPLMKTILGQELAKAGVQMSKALCEHFDHSRAELFDIVRVRAITTFSQLVAEHGRGRGCDVCKPAVASILASLGGGHVLDGVRPQACRTPTTGISPTCRRTAPTRSSRGSPAARSHRPGSSPASSGSTRRSPAGSASISSAQEWSSFR